MKTHFIRLVVAGRHHRREEFRVRDESESGDEVDGPEQVQVYLVSFYGCRLTEDRFRRTYFDRTLEGTVVIPKLQDLVRLKKPL